MLLVATLVIGGCKPQQTPSWLAGPRAPEVLDVLVRPGPTSWFSAPDGIPGGLDHDLLQRFAELAGLPLVPTMVSEPTGELLSKVSEGHARIGAGGVYRPRPGTRSNVVEASYVAPLRPTTASLAPDPAVIQSALLQRPPSLADLAGTRV